MVIPALAIAGANAYKLWNEHWEHQSHLPPLEERTEYAYQNIRTKNFFWGDGDKVRVAISCETVPLLTRVCRLSCKFGFRTKDGTRNNEMRERGNMGHTS